MLAMNYDPSSDFGMEELDDLDAPGWGFWLGVAAGVVTVGGAIAGGVLIAT
ncbi:MAG: daptide-type RiPP [Acidimicrobiales bacterium]